MWKRESQDFSHLSDKFTDDELKGKIKAFVDEKVEECKSGPKNKR